MEMLPSGKLTWEHGNGKSPFCVGNTSSNGPFLIAVLVYRSVIIYVMNCSWTIHLRLNDLKQEMHSSGRVWWIALDTQTSQNGTVSSKSPTKHTQHLESENLPQNSHVYTKDLSRTAPKASVEGLLHPSSHPKLCFRNLLVELHGHVADQVNNWSALCFPPSFATKHQVRSCEFPHLK